MSSTTPPEPKLPVSESNNLSIEERLNRIEFVQDQERDRLSKVFWIANLLQGLTLLSMLAFAYYLGSLTTTLKQTTDKTDKIYALTLESKDSLAARSSAMETTLNNIDKALAKMEGRFDAYLSDLMKRQSLKGSLKSSTTSAPPLIARQPAPRTTQEMLTTVAELSRYGTPPKKSLNKTR